MELHLGCGGSYHAGAFNIDISDLRVADARADATCLPLGDGTVSSVVSHHVIEHLGYGPSVYALAECFRVLEPGGTLILETPDPEASFADFLANQEDSKRAALLSWIFGNDEPGGIHKGLFPPKLLQILVERTGFDEIRFLPPQTHLHRPGYRLEAVSRGGPQHDAYLALAHLRCALGPYVKALSSQELLELEQTLWTPLRQWLKNELPENQGRQTFAFVLATCPLVVCRLSQAMEHAANSLSHHFLPHIQNSQVERIQEVARLCLGANSTELMRRAFEAMCCQIHQKADVYQFVTDRASRVILGWLESGGKNITPKQGAQQLTEALKINGESNDGQFLEDRPLSQGKKGVRGRRPRWPKHPVFTKHSLVLRAHWFRDVAIRCFTRGELETARMLLRLAVNSTHGGIYAIWNMARLQGRMGHLKTSKTFFKNILQPVNNALKNPSDDFLGPLRLHLDNDRKRIEAAMAGDKEALYQVSAWPPVEVGWGQYKDPQYKENRT